MIGSVTPSREAVITVRIYGSASVSSDVKVIIDTGFTHYATLPSALITTLGLGQLGETDAVLSDGSEVTPNTFKAAVLWNGKMRSIQVFAADGDPLMGMAMLYGSRMTVDIVDGGEVSILPLP